MKADHAPVAAGHEVGVATQQPQGDVMRRVLGAKPSTRELSRYADIVDASRGRLSASPGGEVTIDGGSPLEGTNLIAVLQYLTKGARGQSKPIGAEVVRQVLQEGDSVIRLHADRYLLAWWQEQPNGKTDAT